MYNFDEVVNRFGTDSVKWDLVKTNFQTDDIIPMWVADMDFKVLPEIRQALEKRLGHEIYGYSCIGNDYLQAVVDWMKNRHHWEIASDWIVTTPGVVSALAVAVKRMGVLLLKIKPFSVMITMKLILRILKRKLLKTM